MLWNSMIMKTAKFFKIYYPLTLYAYLWLVFFVYFSFFFFYQRQSIILEMIMFRSPLLLLLLLKKTTSMNIVRYLHRYYRFFFYSNTVVFVSKNIQVFLKCSTLNDDFDLWQVLISQPCNSYLLRYVKYFKCRWHKY